MQKGKLKALLPHIVAVVVFIAISFTYFTAQLEGKELQQSDVKNYLGMAKESNDYRDATGDEALWTNSMFGGMPTYLINVKFYRIFGYIHQVMMINNAKPAGYVFLYLLGFYIALLLFRVDPWLSIAGAVAFAFSSYFFIIIEAGHITKAMAIGYMAPIVAGVFETYNRKKLLGAAITGIFLSFQIVVNHLQITYYTLLIILILLIFQVISDIREKKIKNFITASGILAVFVVLAVFSNFTSLYLTYDYGKDSMRGKSELTNDLHNKTSGLDKDYATSWSYGKAETFTLLIPNFQGGASGGSLGTDSEVYKLFKDNQGPEYAKQVIKQLPLYWGPQPFTSGPVYVGAIVLFLFIFGLFLVKGKLKWWLLTATILAITLAWGKHFMFLTDFFLDYFPGYNKFRTVSMILVIAELTIPLLGIIAIDKILKGEIDKADAIKALKYATGITAGFALLFAIAGSAFFDFTTDSDASYVQNKPFYEALLKDRASIFRTDAFRSLIFILLAATLVLLVILKKLKHGLAIAVLAILFLIDMWPVNKRYLNDDDFITKREAKTPYKPTQADEIILKDKDPDFRVLNFSVNTFNDASTSYFHKSIGGYHGAKMKRYQEIIDFYIHKEMQSIQTRASMARSASELDSALATNRVLNMLNTKYMIFPTQNGPYPQKNPGALGNAWFVEKYSIVENADEEIDALAKFEPKSEAIIDKRFENQIENFKPVKDSSASIELLEYKPNYLKYKYSCNSDQLAVFSEIYYSKGWSALIDGESSDYFRANYILRGMKVPAGEHTVEFIFQPKMYYAGIKISMISSAILILLFFWIVYKDFKSRKA